MKRLSIVAICLGVMFFLFSCSRNHNSTTDMGQARLQVRLTDSPFPDAKEVWVDIRQVEVVMGGDSSKPIILDGAHPGVYNLLDFSNGKDTLLADAMIPAGTISQLRLILGDNNHLVTKSNDDFPLKTPSGQESGLKVQVHQEVTGGILYRLVLDFDAGKSVIKAGNSGNYLLKPVLRILSLEPSGGDIKGIVLPDTVRTLVLAIAGADTVASTYSDPNDLNAWLIKDVPAGTYSLSFLPSDTSFKPASASATVTLGQTTIVDTVKLQK